MCGTAWSIDGNLDIPICSARFFRGFEVDPYNDQIAQQLKKLGGAGPKARAGAAEALAFLRAYSAENALIEALNDVDSAVRKEAALAVAWCGSRKAIAPLLGLLEDDDWVVTQAAWVSLTNLSGMELPFDGLAGKKTRLSQIKQWRNWWNDASKQSPPPDVLALLSSEEINDQLRGVRALGALGGKGSSEAIISAIRPYLDSKFGDLSFTQKHMVQSGIRSLGRLRDPAGYSVLMDFFGTADWARYAADALGDYGSGDCVMELIKAYPRFARPLNNRMVKPEIFPSDDGQIGNNTQDRMLETPFHIAYALTRLPLDSAEVKAELRKIGPYLAANLPSDWDGGMFYEIEADQLITAYLLEKGGMRQAACDAAFESAAHTDRWVQQKKDSFDVEGKNGEELFAELSIRLLGDVPYAAAWFPAFCRENDVDRLIPLLEHESGWIRINACKALMFIGADEAVEPIAKLLRESHPEAEYGFSGALEHAEYNDPTPRWREAYVRAIGRLGARQHAGLLTDIIQDDRNVLDIHYAAAFALEEIGSRKAIDALKRVEAEHPLHSVRLIAREALWKRGIEATKRDTAAKMTPSNVVDESTQSAPGKPEALVFIKGNNKVRSDFNGQAGVDPWRQTYTVSNSGPSMRIGRNLFVLEPATAEGKIRQLTHFTRGFVADCEVSWDGTRIVFARRLHDDERSYKQVPYEKTKLKDPSEPRFGGPDDPWWQIWEINADGTGLRQITRGPYHNVAPVYLPDERIVFSSSRIGTRDEYHGFPSVGLTVMNADGSDIHPIGFNLGADRDPSILNDGRIVFSRLDIFYSRLKTEVTLQSVFPDGTRNLSLYGPERRPFFIDLHKQNAAWTMRSGYRGNPDNRNRVLRTSQAQSINDEQVIIATSAGLLIVGPGPYKERVVPHDKKMAVTSPFPIGENTILCAASPKQFEVDGRIIDPGTEEFMALKKGPELFKSAINIDLALYTMNTDTGEMTLLYNDPDNADFEARPIMARPKPPVLAENEKVREESYTAKLFCNSARISRIERVRERGKLLRVIEGQPVVSRHQTQQNKPTNRWKNHGGTKARILGTVPLAADGSFFVEVPADRLLHLQVLDSDRRVIGNQSFWMYARPGETRSCVGCHEQRNEAELPSHFADTAGRPPVKVLPAGDEFSYLAKSWVKGWLADEIEERTRTVHAINLLGRQ